jgi:uncharacterized protein YgiM (DUF1202 family)
LGSREQYPRRSPDEGDSRAIAHRHRRLASAVAVAIALCALTAGTARAESAWVRGGIRLNVRTEPGTQFRIIGVVTTGDGVEILQTREEWTQIRTADGKAGWIPVGYLESEPPPAIRLEQLEAETTRLSEELETSNATTDRLEKESAEISEKDRKQLAEISRLTRDNLELRAGARWPEWIVGASVLAAGMLIGAVLHRNSTRRPSSRIRL